MSEKAVISKCMFRMENSDGTYNEVTTIMPVEVAHDMTSLIMNWKSKYSASFKEVEIYLNAYREFTNKEK